MHIVTAVAFTFHADCNIISATIVVYVNIMQCVNLAVDVVVTKHITIMAFLLANYRSL